MHNRAYGFVDGGYLRKVAEEHSLPLVDPHNLVENVVSRQGYSFDKSTRLVRVIYYDARPDNESEIPEELERYWDAIELLADTHLGFGSLRGKSRKRPPRQKAVDTLLAVDMLVGAFTENYSVAVLVSGDADFVPVIKEVQRRGPTVIVAAERKTASTELIQAADRFTELQPDSSADMQKAYFKAMS